MPRPISWQRNLNSIHRRVTESAQTPYTRGHLETLFKVGKDAAKKMLQLMPRVQQGNAAVVEREDLLAFLSGCIDAEDLSAHLKELAKNPPKPSRRKVRVFVPGNFVRGQLQPLSVHNIWLKRGELRIDFTTFDDFCSKLNLLIGVIEDPAFERRFCEEPPQITPAQTRERLEAALIRAETKYLVKLQSMQEAIKQGHTEIAELFCAEADATLAEVVRLSTECGVDVDEFLIRVGAKLRALFPLPTPEPDLQTSSQSSSAPPAAETSPPAAP